MDQRLSTLAVRLPSDLEIVLSRTLNAPSRLVFEAWTDPRHVRQWYGCGTMKVACEADVRVGGDYRYTMTGADGVEHTMRGVYHEISPPGRLVYTQQYVTTGFSSSEALCTVIMVEIDGRTTVTATILHQSRADRDGHLQSGMEGGARESFDRLDDYLATMA